MVGRTREGENGKGDDVEGYGLLHENNMGWVSSCGHGLVAAGRLHNLGVRCMVYDGQPEVASGHAGSCTMVPLSKEENSLSHLSYNKVSGGCNMQN